ncbi:hypothetical protein [Niabella aquatica]
MTSVNPNYSFNIQQNATGSYTCTWKPAILGFRFALPLIWIAGILSLAGAILTFNNSKGPASGILGSFIPNWITYFLLLYVGTLVIVNIVIRRGGRFSFDKEGFSVGNSHYANKDIIGLYVRSPRGEKMEMLSYTTYGGFGVADTVRNVASGINAASTEARMALMRAVREKSYSVCIQYGEREIRLAQHLTVLTAKSLLHKIDELI